MVLRTSRANERLPPPKRLFGRRCSGSAKHGTFLAVAIVVMPPAPVVIAQKLATNTDIVVGLNLTEAFGILDPHRICATALGNVGARSFLALGKHLRCLVALNRILREYTIRDVVNTYLIVFTGSRSQNRHCCFSFRIKSGGIQDSSVLSDLVMSLVGHDLGHLASARASERKQ